MRLCDQRKNPVRPCRLPTSSSVPAPTSSRSASSRYMSSTWLVRLLVNVHLPAARAMSCRAVSAAHPQVLLCSSPLQALSVSSPYLCPLHEIVASFDTVQGAARVYPTWTVSRRSVKIAPTDPERRFVSRAYRFTREGQTPLCHERLCNLVKGVSFRACLAPSQASSRRSARHLYLVEVLFLAQTARQWEIAVRTLLPLTVLT